MKLNLGCGFQTPDGWVNVDYAFGARFSKSCFIRMLNRKFKFFGGDWPHSVLIHNLQKTFPWAENSIDVVYTSHTLEHFAKDEGARFLSECHRVLRPEGVLRVLVPDLNPIVKQYCCGDLAAPDFIRALGVVNIPLGFLCLNYFKNHFSSHKCMYDATSLVGVLNDVGFSAHSCAPFSSTIPDIESIEQESRAIDAVIVEGRKK